MASTSSSLPAALPPHLVIRDLHGIDDLTAANELSERSFVSFEAFDLIFGGCGPVEPAAPAPAAEHSSSSSSSPTSNNSTTTTAAPTSASTAPPSSARFQAERTLAWEAERWRREAAAGIPPEKRSSSRNLGVFDTSISSSSSASASASASPSSSSTSGPGKLVGWAFWFLAPDPSSPDAVPADPTPPPGCNLGLYRHFIGGMEASRHRYWRGRDRGYGLLYTLVVDPARQRRGIGAALVREGLAWLDARGWAGGAWLDASPEGLGLYERFGFERVHVTEADLVPWGGKGVARCVGMAREKGAAAAVAAVAAVAAAAGADDGKVMAGVSSFPPS